MEDLKRNADGTFAEGNSGGPGKKRMTWQDYADRVSKWQETPFEEIEAIVNDPTRLKKLVSRDAQIVKQIYDAMTKTLTGPDERERLLDREVGKAVSRSEVGGPNGGSIPINSEVTLRIESA